MAIHLKALIILSRKQLARLFASRPIYLAGVVCRPSVFPSQPTGVQKLARGPLGRRSICPWRLYYKLAGELLTWPTSIRLAACEFICKFRNIHIRVRAFEPYNGAGWVDVAIETAPRAQPWR